MYTREQLEKFPYFAERLKETDISGLLDQLTGIVTRGHILWFAQWLIDHRIPFSFAMLDLDNFKFINDTYGHHIGDGVLAWVARKLAECLDGFGVAGRFGGDEFLFVNLRDTDYQACKAFMTEIYEGKVLRRNVPLEDCYPFVTGTVGCAIYPKDAADFDSLFGLIDKTLYRGKTKGRNCHIIYVEEKHKNIEIRQIARYGMYTTLSSLVRQFELVPGLINKMRVVTPLMMEQLQISDLFYVGRQKIIRSIRNTVPEEPVSDLENLLRGDYLFADNKLDEVRKRSPDFCRILEKRNIETLCVARIGIDRDTDGYLICAEARNRRIWQEADCAILFFLAKMLAARIRIDGEILE